MRATAWLPNGRTSRSEVFGRWRISNGYGDLHPRGRGCCATVTISGGRDRLSSGELSARLCPRSYPHDRLRPRLRDDGLARGRTTDPPGGGRGPPRRVRGGRWPRIE